jgi:DNA-binding CsgD family transcriptional regulator
MLRGTRLTERERYVLNCLASGLTPNQIAARNNWSHNTPRNFVARAKQRLGTRTTVQTVVRFKQMEGLLGTGTE